MLAAVYDEQQLLSWRFLIVRWPLPCDQMQAYANLYPDLHASHDVGAPQESSNELVQKRCHPA